VPHRKYRHTRRYRGGASSKLKEATEAYFVDGVKLKYVRLGLVRNELVATDWASAFYVDENIWMDLIRHRDGARKRLRIGAHS